jgi:RNA polymerase sigma-70 factor (ECF subfamily)
VKGGFPVSLILEEQYDKLYAYCYFRTKNAALAEDITQEAFLRFFSQSSYISRGKPLAYLYTIAKNLCADHYRRPPPLPLAEDIADSGAGIDTLETSLAVRAAVAALPEDWQELLLLRYANELSLAEIGTVTGLSRFAIHRKLQQALGKLKELLREEDFA